MLLGSDVFSLFGAVLFLGISAASLYHLIAGRKSYLTNPVWLQGLEDKDARGSALLLTCASYGAADSYYSHYMLTLCILGGVVLVNTIDLLLVSHIIKKGRARQCGQQTTYHPPWWTGR